MKLLNLDKISPIVRQVEVAGQKYNVASTTVGQMLEALQFVESLEAEDSTAYFKSMVRTAKQILPDAPESVIHRLTPTQMRALIEFANAGDEEVVAASGDAEEKK